MKPTKPKNTAGVTPVLPMSDNDEAFNFYDIQGESLYTNPPDMNNPFIDHGTEENDIWAFRMSPYNQDVVINPFHKGLYSALRRSNAPYWGHKLGTMAFFKEDKMKKFAE